MLLNCYGTLLPEAGTDEAGRGCLAGPVTASAVILPDNFQLKSLNDSKKLSEKMRNELRPYIEEQAISFSVVHFSPIQIDEYNILKASILAMHEAINLLKVSPAHIAVDGNRFIPFENIPHTCLVKGDARFTHIAAASILAKTYRDDLMKKLHEDYPMYQWNKNKGYPTKEHRDAIKKYGPCEHHRRSFKLLPDEQLKLEL
jgi:ribonuclease HII